MVWETTFYLQNDRQQYRLSTSHLFEYKKISNYDCVQVLLHISIITNLMDDLCANIIYTRHIAHHIAHMILYKTETIGNNFKSSTNDLVTFINGSFQMFAFSFDNFMCIKQDLKRENQISRKST